MLRNVPKIGKSTVRPSGSATVAKQRLLSALEFDRLQCDRGADGSSEKLSSAHQVR